MSLMLLATLMQTPVYAATTSSPTLAVTKKRPGRIKPADAKKKATQKKRKIVKERWNSRDDFHGELNSTTIIAKSGFTPQFGVGVDYRLRSQKGKPTRTVRETRVGGDIGIGVLSGSMGGGVHGQTLIGPKMGDFTLLFGSGLWWNGYGAPLSSDYHLPKSAGLSGIVAARLDLSTVALNGQLTPSMAFKESRQRLGVDEFSWSLGVDGHTGWGDWRVNYEHRANAIFAGASVVSVSVSRKL